MSRDPDPVTYLRPGGVLVPATLAGPLLDLITPSLPALVEHARVSATPVRADLLAVLGALNAADVAHDHARISAIGNAAPPTATVVDVRTPEDAGRAVGLTGRRIRQLCADGLVVHQRAGARGYLVDLDSLHAYLRHTTSSKD
jgi:hypothetical protein